MIGYLLPFYGWAIAILLVGLAALLGTVAYQRRKTQQALREYFAAQTPQQRAPAKRRKIYDA